MPLSSVTICPSGDVASATPPMGAIADAAAPPDAAAEPPALADATVDPAAEADGADELVLELHAATSTIAPRSANERFSRIPKLSSRWSEHDYYDTGLVVGFSVRAEFFARRRRSGPRSTTSDHDCDHPFDANHDRGRSDIRAGREDHRSLAPAAGAHARRRSRRLRSRSSL